MSAPERVLLPEGVRPAPGLVERLHQQVKPHEREKLELLERRFRHLRAISGEVYETVVEARGELTRARSELRRADEYPELRKFGEVADFKQKVPEPADARIELRLAVERRERDLARLEAEHSTLARRAGAARELYEQCLRHLGLSLAVA